MLFHYHYIDAKGKKKKGFLEAQHLQEAKERLRRQNILITHLTQSKSSKRNTPKLKTESLITFTTQLAGLLQAGMPLYESLITLEEQYHEEVFHPILITLCEKIKAGSQLSEAMNYFPDSFNRLYCSMVAAGESVGALDQTLERLASLLRKQSKLKKQIVTALLYPAFLFAFSLGVAFMLLSFVIPSLELLFEERAVNRFTQTIILISHFLNHQWMFYLPVATLSGFGCYVALTSVKGRHWLQRQLLRLPILKTLITQTAIARFARGAGTLLQGGVSLIETLQIARKVMHHPLFEEVIEKAEGRIIEGSLLSIELKKSPLIPPLVPRLLAIGEEGGKAASMLQKIADLYEDEVEKSITRLTSLAQPIILLIMGAIVGTIMLAVLLPLTDVSAFL